MEQPINAIDIETLNITLVDQSQYFKICLWGNTGKNPRFNLFKFQLILRKYLNLNIFIWGQYCFNFRVKQIVFQNDKFTMELPKVMALSDVALRVIYMDLDIFSSKCCTFEKTVILENKQGNPEVCFLYLFCFVLQLLLQLLVFSSQGYNVLLFDRNMF